MQQFIRIAFEEEKLCAFIYEMLLVYSKEVFPCMDINVRKAIGITSRDVTKAPKKTKKSFQIMYIHFLTQEIFWFQKSFQTWVLYHFLQMFSTFRIDVQFDVKKRLMDSRTGAFHLSMRGDKKMKKV